MVKANAQQLELVADINTEGSAFSQFDSRPRNFTEFNNKLYFSARNPKSGQELFSYDGTDVELIADINPGTDASGNNYNNSNPSQLTIFDNKLYFVATNDGDSAYLYSYDGVSAPSVAVNLHVPENQTNYINLVVYNNKLHFNTYNATTDSVLLWDFDGTNTVNQIHSVFSTTIGYSFKSFVEFNGDLYYFKNGSYPNVASCFKYDGTNAPSKITSFSGLTNFGSEAIVYNNKIHFQGFSNSGPAGSEMYSYDGVSTPTLVHDINPGIQGSSIKNFTIFNNKLYFSAWGPNSPNNELWSYDGTTTVEVADINPSGSSSPSFLTVYNSKLYFTATDGTNGYELWEYDGTNTPSITEEMRVGAGGGSPKYMTVFQNELFFAATDGTVAEEVYKYDGTSISLVANIYDGSNGSTPSYFTEYKNKMYFSAYGNSESGVELYSYDGTSVALVADIDTAHLAQYGAGSSSQPQNFFVFNDLLYFRATDGIGYKTWKYDGVNAPTIDTNLPDNAGNFIIFDSKLLFRSYDATTGTELWQYDGTTAATMVYDINPGTGSGIGGNKFTIFNNKLIFNATDGVNGLEMWQYDGVNTPSIIADIYPGAASSYASQYKEYDGKLYFSAQADTIIGTELYMYDGTNAPSLVADILPGLASNGYAHSSYPSYLNIINDKLIFVARDTSNIKNIWEYDFVNAPLQITNYSLTGFAANYQFSSMTAIDDILYFWADEALGFGSELYKYDGTGSPTMFDEVNVGVANSRPSNPSNLLKYDGDIYLSANDGVLGWVNGGELYKIAACGLDETVTQNAAQLTANETGATYQWVDCNNNNTAIAGETNQTFTATVSGDYACIVTKAGCETTTACKNVIISGIEDIDLKSKIAIYPNPSSDLLNIKTDIEVYSINIYNVIGKKVQAETNTSFSIAALNQGIYFVEVITAEGTMNTQIIKK